MYDNRNIQHTSHEAYMYFRSFFEGSGAISLLLAYLPAKTVDSVPCTVHLNNLAAFLPLPYRQYFVSSINPDFEKQKKTKFVVGRSRTSVIAIIRVSIYHRLYSDGTRDLARFTRGF